MDFRRVIRARSSLAEDGNIFLKLQIKESGETVDLNPCITTNRK